MGVWGRGEAGFGEGPRSRREDAVQAYGPLSTCPSSLARSGPGSHSSPPGKDAQGASWGLGAVRAFGEESSRLGRYFGASGRGGSPPNPTQAPYCSRGHRGRTSPRPPRALTAGSWASTPTAAPAAAEKECVCLCGLRGMCVCVGGGILKQTTNLHPPARGHLSCSEMNFGKRLAPNLI